MDGAVLLKVAVDREIRVFDSAVRLSIEGIRLIGELLESSIKVFLTFFSIRIDCKILRFSRNSPGELIHHLFLP